MSIPYSISGSDVGLKTDQKPYLLPDKAFQVLENAFVFRDRVRKRRGITLLGRLRRVLTAQASGNITLPNPFPMLTGTVTVNLFTGIAFLGEPNAQFEPGNITAITIVIAAPIAQTLTDSLGTGILTVSAGIIKDAFLNYSTGDLTLVYNAPGAAASASTFTGAYYPGLSVMGIKTREVATYNLEQTIFFDQKYAYIFVAGEFQEWIPGTTWDSSDSDFFWAANYRGSAEGSRLFFVTNFLSTATNKMYYTDGIVLAWVPFNPILTDVPESATKTLLFAAQFLIPYYGRLIALNTIEGVDIASQKNIFNRCRFAQVGDPTQVDAWRSDKFGKGGFIDAPVNESITGVGFIKNTLIVEFEYSTWQLRYVGEYGLPFIWERISSDFGSSSPFAPVIFNDFLATVGNRAIISANAARAERMDLAIPDLVFDVLNANNGTIRVHGIRDYQQELIYWCYPDSLTLDPSKTQYYPNTVLVYNYRNNTYAKFHDSITCFGTLQIEDNVTWDSNRVTWNDDVLWDDVVQNDDFPYIVAGNQQGFVFQYGYGTSGTDDDESLAIVGIANINSATLPIRLKITNHNLSTGDFILIESMKFVDAGVSPLVSLNSSINNVIYKVNVIDRDHVDLLLWNVPNQQYVSFPTILFSNASTGALGAVTPTYVGGGVVTVLPVLLAQTKDFNPFSDKGLQLKLTHVDFLMDTTAGAEMTINVLANTSDIVVGNLALGNTQVETYVNEQVKVGLVTGVTLGNPNTVISSYQHGLSIDLDVTFNSIIGTTQLNGNQYTITAVTPNTFTVNVDSSLFTAYAFGGAWVASIPNQFMSASTESDISWHRFFANVSAAYINLALTYDDNLMNRMDTHQQDWTLNAMTLYMRPAGKSIFA